MYISLANEKLFTFKICHYFARYMCNKFGSQVTLFATSRIHNTAAKISLTRNTCIILIICNISMKSMQQVLENVKTGKSKLKHSLLLSFEKLQHGKGGNILRN